MKKFIFVLILLYFNNIYAQSGELDKTFGNNGIVITSVNSENVKTVELLINNENKILSAGSVGEGSSSDFFIIQQNSDGSLDQSFGDGGIQTLSLGPAKDVCNFMKLDAQDRIYVGGSGFAFNEWNNVEIARLNLDGSLDLSFGTQGYISQDFGTNNDVANGLAFQQDGKLIVVGNLVEKNDINFLVARFLSNGEVDSTFGLNGYSTFDFDGAADDARNVNVLPNGKIVVIGVSTTNIPLKTIMKIIQLDMDGNLDMEFGTNGELSFDLSSTITEPRGVKVYDNGDLLIGCQIGTKDFGLIKFNQDGILDKTFGTNGLISHTVTNTQINTSYEFIQQNDGDIIVCGFSGDYPYYQTCLLGLNSTGAIDSTFGDNGISLNDLSDSTNLWTNIVESSDDRFLVAGYANNTSVYDHLLGKFISELSVGTIDILEGVNDILVYPNPIKSVEFLEYSLNSEQNLSIILYDLNGKLIQTLLPTSNRVSGNHKEVLSINTNLPSGQYYLTITGMSFTNTIKVLKK